MQNVESTNTGARSTSARARRTAYVVLPAYNEASNLGAVLAALSEARARQACMDYHPIVVNDGSSDSTGEVVRGHDPAFAVTLIEHERNLGLGAAIRTGLLKAVDLATDEDVIVTMDADDTQTPSAIALMIAKIDQGFDVVIASRYQPGGEVVGVPAFRRLLSYGASLLFRTVYPIRGVRDFTCGYRAYRASVLRSAIQRYRHEFINQEGFQCMVDILLKLSRMNLRFTEIPLVLRYDRKGGKSKMKVARTVFKTLELLVRRRVGI